MAAPNPKKRALSDRLKNMRFMKRREETSLREKLIQDQKQRQRDAQWTTQFDAQHGKTTPIVLIEDGISGDPLYPRHGRQSFGKFNTVFEHDAPTTLSEAPCVDRTDSNHPNHHLTVQPDDEKPCKEEPLLAAGLNRPEHSHPEKHPTRQGNTHIQPPRKTILKRKKKKTGPTKP